MTKHTTHKARVIFHIDMNCFYASVEVAHNEALKGRALAIAGNPEERKGIIVTSSYEARAKGVKTTMPLWEARKLCPELIVLRPNFDRYRQASKQLFKLLTNVTPLVEPVSIDEGYLDVTDVTADPVALAEALQKKVLHTLNLPCSIGIGPNKFLAKMASDMKKPLGITILRKRDLPVTLWPQPVNIMYGVGDKTAEKLQSIGVTTIGELAKADVYALKQVLGINGERLKNRANGIDSRMVDPDAVHDFKSIGSSQTLSHDTTDEKEIIALMTQLSENVSRRLKRKQAAGRTVQVMIRYSDRQTVTRSRKLQAYIESPNDIKHIACDLFFQHWNSEPVRLIGITMQDVSEKTAIAYQLDLFTYKKEEQKAKLQSVVTDLSKKFGPDTFKQVKESNQDNDIRTSFQKDFLDDFKHE
ncbi:DNA polymerase IV [Lentibacillus saliphilus]|uniref:DNA polymerase IV n=1 Tax=Lentibacillus saliphilus TaxID=2737028 RepID=UPI001C304E3F|nr:DNA polymerase IV [Lentibacillus saliphilus]